MQKITKKIKSIWQKWAKKRRDFLKTRPHRSFKMTKWQNLQPVLQTVRKNITQTFATIWTERKILFWLALIYIIVSYIFIGGIAQTDFVDFKQSVVEAFGGKLDSLSTVFTLFSSTMAGGLKTNLSELQQFLAAFLAILLWLAVIWTLRMRFANQKIDFKDALYSSAAPLVSYVVVGLLIVVQLLPGALGIVAYGIAQNGGFLQGGVEVMMFALAAFLFCCLSFYWASTSLFALVIVTLPQMRPWRAMQISGEMIIGRRFRIFCHLIALALVIVLCWAIALLPALLLDAWLKLDWLPLLPTITQIMGAFTVIFAGTYIYKLYRSMI